MLDPIHNVSAKRLWQLSSVLGSVDLDRMPIIANKNFRVFLSMSDSLNWLQEQKICTQTLDEELMHMGIYLYINDFQPTGRNRWRTNKDATNCVRERTLRAIAHTSTVKRYSRDHITYKIHK